MYSIVLMLLKRAHLKTKGSFKGVTSKNQLWAYTVNLHLNKLFKEGKSIVGVESDSDSLALLHAELMSFCKKKVSPKREKLMKL